MRANKLQQAMFAARCSKVAHACGLSKGTQQYCAAAGVSFSCHDERGFKSLHCAAERGYAAVVEALLAAGESPRSEPAKYAKDATTPLLLATASEEVSVLKALLAAGAQIYCVPELSAALGVAVKEHDAAMVQALLAAGAEVSWNSVSSMHTIDC